MTLAPTVREAARRFAGAPALVTEHGDELTYAELDRRSDEVAAGLAAAGVGPGGVVALVLPSGVAYVVAYAAAAKLGAATAGVNPRLTAPERAALVDVADPALVVTTADLADGTASERPTVVLGPAAEGAGRPGDDGAWGLGPLVVDGATCEPPPPDPDRLVALVFTSGTTGTPRAAEFAEAELAAITAADVGDRWGGGGAVLASTQMAHVGFMTKLPWYLRLGGPLVLLDRWRAGTVLRLVERHRIASLGGVAPQLALLLRSPVLDEVDVSSVATIVMGGALSPPALVREARARFDAAYSIRYSSTESGGVGTATALDADDHEALHTVGRPRPGVALRLVDEDGTEVGRGEVGEVVLRSPCTMRGYHGDATATAEVLRDGWLRTGDLGRLDEHGCLVLAGRRKEVYVRGGYNVHPAEVEAALADHPAVAEVAVVPRPDPVMGEVGVAVVVPSDPASPPSLEDLRDHLADHLAAWKHPEALRVVDGLPLTAMQKVDKRTLAAAEAESAAAWAESAAAEAESAAAEAESAAEPPR